MSEVEDRERPVNSFVGTRSIFSSLAHRNFLLLWLGQITHSCALWMDMIGTPVLVLAVTDSSVHLGLVMGMRMVPSVVLGPLAGVIADSIDRRMVLVITKIVVFILSLLFVIILISGWIQLWHIYVFTLFRGVTMAFDQPARRAMIPSLVPKYLITNAIALSTGSMQAMRILGAGGAGIVIAVFGINAVFVVIVAIYASALLVTLLLRTPYQSKTGFRGVVNMGVDMLEGIKFAWNEPAIRGIIVSVSVYYAFGMAFMTVFAPLVARNVLEIGDSGFGYIMATAGAGGILGAMSLAALNPRTRRGMMTIVVMICVGILLVMFSVSTYFGSVVIAFSIALILGAAMSWVFPLVDAVLMDSAPENMRGRVVGLLSFDRALATVGSTTAGLVAALVGVQIAQMIFGFACVASAVIVVLSNPKILRID